MSDHHIIHLGSGGLVLKPCLTLETPWTVAPQAPLSTGFSRQNIGVGCHFLLQGNLPNPRIEPWSPALQADCLPTELPEKPLIHLKLSQ